MRPVLVLLVLATGLLPSTLRAYEGAVERVEKPEEPKAPTLTKAPELVTFVEATYPEEAQKQQLTGEVGLLVDIGADGKVAHAEVATPAGHGFDEAAVEAVKQFVFTPAELDGVPSLVRIQYTYRFVLKEVPAPPPAPDAPPPQAPESLVGVAIERASRKPLIGANVHCDETGEDVMTDDKGRFVLHLHPGKYLVRVAAGGYHPFKREEVIEEGKQLEVTYHLMPLSYGLFQTVVRAERDKREATQRTLEREELQKVPGTMGDPIRVIQNLPGVARAPYLGGQLIVRGAAPEETGAYLDSVEIPLLFHFMGGPSVVNPEFMDKLDFLPGGFGSRYGRAIGGIIDAYTRRGAADQAHGNLKIDLLDTALFLEAPIGDSFSVAGAARRSYLDALLPLVMPDDSITLAPVYWDYQVRADYGRKGDKHQFTLMAFGSDDRTSVAATGEQKERNLKVDFHTNFHRVRLSWLYRDGKLTNLLMPWFGRDDQGGSLASGESTEALFSGSGISWAYGLRDELAYELPGGHTVRVGADIAVVTTEIKMTVPSLPEYRVFPGANPYTGESQTIERSPRDLDWGFYNEWDLKLTDRLTAIPGVRLDLFHYAGRTHLATDPRLVLRYKLFDQTLVGIGTTVKGSVGHYTMAPGSLYADKKYGNPELGLPKAFQASLGVEHKITDVIDVDVTGFYNRRYDTITSSSKVTVQDDGTVVPEYYSNEGLGRAYGVEFMLRHNVTDHFFGWLAYTLSRTEERRRGGEYRLGSYDETHILTLVGTYRFGNGFSVGGRFRLVSGRPATPVLGSTFDSDSNTYGYIPGEPRSIRNPLFHQLDLRVDKEWLFDKWKFGVYLDVQNVYNAKNVEAVQWDYRYKYKAEIPGLPILPTLGLKGSF